MVGRFSIFVATGIAVAACGGTGVRVVSGAGDERVYEARCKTSTADCIGGARSTCSGGYTVLDSDSHAGGLLADALPGPVTWYSMTFKCDAFGSSETPDFAFRGQRYVPPSAAVTDDDPSQTLAPTYAPSAGTPSLGAQPSTTPTSRPAGGHDWGCSSDFECGFGNLCIKPQGSFNGTCARAVNQSGTPTFAPPRPNSVGPGGDGQCAFDTECPIGFKCIKGSSLRGNCMK